jgi:trans-AT polyketide synthase, acyltransferase and oxidoreductase domains
VLTSETLAPFAPASPHADAVAVAPAAVVARLARIREPLYILRDPSTGLVGLAGPDAAGTVASGQYEVLGSLAPLFPEWLGDRSFTEVHGLRFPYVVGEMANGIASTDMVIAAARTGVLGFFGSAGLSPERVEAAIDTIEAALGPAGLPWGMNLIHSPHEPGLESATVDLFLRRAVRRVSASAFLALTPNVVRYACTGLRQAPDGSIVRQNHVFAKISRPEVAEPFMSPAPPAMLQALVSQGHLTAEEAALAARVPLAEDVTAEADSGGHTDNRPLTALFPTILGLRNTLVVRHGFTRPIRVGAGGGLGAPAAVAAAFALGAAYVMTGSINQSAVESGLSEAGRAMLGQAGLADVIMAPAGDMFEMGVKVQVLRRGTMFAARGTWLYELYSTYPSLEALPEAVRARLEREIFQRPIAQVWADTEAYFRQRDPQQVARAAEDPRHRMALAFRWYLGHSSRWAIAGDPARRMDYQIWCGPAMGAFNAWVAGSFLEPVAHRTVEQIARNLLEGAAVITRAQQARTCGVPVPPDAFSFAPRPLA